MIWVTRTDGEPLMLNDDQILYLEAPHDTLLVLSTGERLRILEEPEVVADRIAAWRRRVMGLEGLGAPGGFEDDPA